MFLLFFVAEEIKALSEFVMGRKRKRGKGRRRWDGFGDFLGGEKVDLKKDWREE